MSEMSEMFFNYDQLRAFVWQKKIYLDKEDILYFLCVTEDFFFFSFLRDPPSSQYLLPVRQLIGPCSCVNSNNNGRR